MVSDLNNLAFSPYNFSSRHYLGSLPDVISEIVEPKLDLPKVQMIVNKELPGTQILVTVFEKNESGEEIITAQNSYPLGEHVLKLPVKSYLGGRVIFEATYSFGCKAAPQK